MASDEENNCLWCGRPTTERLGPHGRMSVGKDEHEEAWHWACFAERQAWSMAVDASETRLEDWQRAQCMAGVGQLWLALSQHLRGGSLTQAHGRIET